MASRRKIVKIGGRRAHLLPLTVHENTVASSTADVTLLWRGLTPEAISDRIGGSCSLMKRELGVNHHLHGEVVREGAALASLRHKRWYQEEARGLGHAVDQSERVENRPYPIRLLAAARFKWRWARST